MNIEKLKGVLGDESRKKRISKGYTQTCSLHELVAGIRYMFRVLPKSNMKNPDGYFRACWHKNPDYDVKEQKGHMVACLEVAPITDKTKFYEGTQNPYCPFCYVLTEVEDESITARISMQESFFLAGKMISAKDANGDVAVFNIKDTNGNHIGTYTFPDQPGFVRVISFSSAGMDKFVKNIMDVKPDFDDPFAGRNIIITKLKNGWDMGLDAYDSPLDMSEYQLLTENTMKLSSLLGKKILPAEEMEKMVQHIPGMERYNDTLFS